MIEKEERKKENESFDQQQTLKLFESKHLVSGCWSFSPVHKDRLKCLNVYVKLRLGQ